MKLNLGCGIKKIDGFVGVDNIKTEAVDIIHDLNIFPYPFEDGSVDEIIMDNVLEHLDDVIKVIEELHRLCVPGAIVKINVPYFKSNSAYTDPTHKHFFTETSFKYFTKDNPLNFYSQARFEIAKACLISHTEYKDIKHVLRNLLPFKRVLNYFVSNMYDEIRFELRCLKQ